jgi:hypothetical protein
MTRKQRLVFPALVLSCLASEGCSRDSLDFLFFEISSFSGRFSPCRLGEAEAHSYFQMKINNEIFPT